jgi:hypothetical protein
MPRDHRSTYQRRNELAQARGYRSYADERRQRAEGRPLASDTGARPDLRQIQPVGDGSRRMVRNTGTAGGGERVLAGQLQRADRVSITATLSDGRVVNALGRGGWSAAKFARKVDELGSVEAAVAYMVAEVYGDEAGGIVADFTLDLS